MDTCGGVVAHCLGDKNDGLWIPFALNPRSAIPYMYVSRRLFGARRAIVGHTPSLTKALEEILVILAVIADSAVLL